LVLLRLRNHDLVRQPLLHTTTVRPGKAGFQAPANVISRRSPPGGPTATAAAVAKDCFGRDPGGEAEAYQEVARRLGLLPEGEANMVLDLDQHRAKRGK
jgi:hypothetical protein